jgi:hypothetical protein
LPLSKAIPSRLLPPPVVMPRKTMTLIFSDRTTKKMMPRLRS